MPMTTKRKRQAPEAATAAAALEAAKHPWPSRLATSNEEERVFRSLLASCAPSPVPPAFGGALAAILDDGGGGGGAGPRLKTDARLPPNARTSDLPLRLFHQRRRCAVAADASAAVVEPIASPKELAAVIAIALQTALASSPSAEPSSSVVITAVSVVSEAQAALGIPPDRLILQLREIARVSLPAHSPTASTLRWLHRDESIGVVDKPAGVLSVDGNDPTLGPSVHCQVRARFPDARMVHRLDLETSGLLVVALTRGAAQHLNKQFRDRTVSKTYYARVAGRVDWAESQRRLRLPMERDPERKLLQRVVTDRDVPDDSALWSVTDVTVVDAGDESTLVELRPETGKTHQLRVHMLHVGHPILGDSLYAPASVKALAPRLCLHAARLVFTHPDTDESLEFESACPF